MTQNIRQRSEYSAPRRGGARNSRDRQLTVIAVLMMACALLVFIALVSYDPGDEANADIELSDLWKVFTNDAQVRAKADTAHNWLGLVGAIISDVLIKSTVGYSVFCFPILLMIWGWTLLRRADSRKLVSATNYALVSALLISSAFGMVRLLLDEGSIGMEWSGVVGDFLASVLTQLLGKAGGAVVVLTAMLITAVLAIDLDLQRSAERVKTAALQLADWLSRTWDAWRSARSEERYGSTEPDKSPVKIARPPLEEPASLAKKQDVPKAPVVASPVSAAASEPVIVAPTTPRHITFEIEQRFEEQEPGSDETATERVSEEIDYVFPSVDLLDAPRAGKEQIADEELEANAELLRSTLAEFDVEVESVSVTPGPVVTLYELVPSTGVKISRIVSLENDIALKLAAKGIRIIAPIPGKSAVGVEIPNQSPALVSIRSVINSSKFRETSARLPLAMGKTISGEVFTDDLTRMPHLLIAGATGSGKSVGINTILASLLYRLHPSDLKLVIIDPKKIELAQYARLRNHFLAISPDVDEEIITNPKNAVFALKGVEYEMEKRYDRLAAAGVRNIVDYNDRLKGGRLKDTEAITHVRMPYLVVVIDELADLMITAAKEVEEPIARLAQLARAVGIHLIVATQRPSVDVITGVIKANFPARIAYQVSSKIDSRTILDMNGAEQLLGNGDMLYLASGSPKPVRLQNAFISTDEVEALMEFIAKQTGYARPFMLPSIADKKRGSEDAADGERDELFEEAARLIVRHQQGSVSLLQRRLKVGYSRAARLVDELEAAGIVGPFDGSKAREVLVESEQQLDLILGG